MGDLKQYPVSMEDMYRMLGVLGNLTVRSANKQKLIKHIGNDKFFKLFKQAMSEEISNPMSVVYDHLIERKDFTVINKYFEITLGKSMQQLITIFEPFAHTGGWLSAFKTAVYQDSINSAQTYLIANGNKDVSDKGFNESYSISIDNFNHIPKGSVSLLLFNPPCNPNKKGQTRQLLETIIERKFLYRAKGDSDYNHNGKLVMVINQTEFLDNLSYMVTNFEIEHEIIYKVNKKDYKQNQQLVVFASIRDELMGSHDAIQSEKEEISKIVVRNSNFNLKMYQVVHKDIPSVPYYELKKNHQIIEESNYEKSDLKNDNWNWIKDATRLKDNSSEKIIKPTALKAGELVNVLASGMINGDIQLQNGKGKHIVAGGMRQKEQFEEVVEISSDGREQLIKKKLIYSEPYLNILINQNGKARIKSLYGEMGVETE